MLFEGRGSAWGLSWLKKGLPLALGAIVLFAGLHSPQALAQQTPSLTIVKQVIGTPPATDWVFTVTQPDNNDVNPDPTIPAQGGQEVLASLALTGSYTIVETEKPGFTVEVSCVDNNVPGNDFGPLDDNQANVTVMEDSDIVCTFTNTRNRITIVKQVIGATPGADWSFTATGPSGDVPVSDIPAVGGQTTLTELEAGTHTLIETEQDGYAVEVSCIDKNNPGNDAGPLDDNQISPMVMPGSDIVCTFVNTELVQGAQLTIIKQVNGLPPDAEWEFMRTNPDDSMETFTIPAKGGQRTFQLDAGTYTVIETKKFGWAVSVSCSGAMDPGAQIQTSENSASVMLMDGDDIKCTFVNTATTSGTISVVKLVNGATPATPWNFKLSPAPPQNQTNPDGTFSLPPDGEQKNLFVNPGTYTLSETLKDGYLLTSLQCTTSGQPVGTVQNNKVVFSIDAQEHIVCIFTNSEEEITGRLIVAKEVAGLAPAEEWLFTGTGGIGPFSLAAAGGQRALDLPVGTYTVSETTKTGYDVSLRCTRDGAQFINNSNSNSVTVNLGAEQEVICTFTNTAQKATITVVKEVVPAEAAPATVWAFTGSLGNFSIAPLGGTVSFSNLNAGAYTITETLKEGFSVSVGCNNGVSSNSNSVALTVNPGQNVICTFTNTSAEAGSGEPGTMTIEKKLTPGTSTPSSSWQYTVEGPLSTNFGVSLPPGGGSQTFFNRPPGQYAITELGKSGYRVVEIVCIDGNNQQIATSNSGGVFFTLPPGDEVICSFKNGPSDSSGGGSLTVATLLDGEGNDNGMLDTAEILTAVAAWLNGASLGGESVSTQVILQLVALWLSAQPIAEINSVAATPQAVQTLVTLAGLDAEAHALSVRNVQAIPSPSHVRFALEGQGIESFQVRVYSLRGELVYASDEVSGRQWRWNLWGDDGVRVANGVYLYTLTIRGIHGQRVNSEVKKLMVLR